MSLATVRTELASVASSVEGLSVRASGVVRTPKIGDGWLAVQRLEPAGFRTQAVTIAIVVCLGADLAKADDLLDELGPALLDAVTNAIAAANVVLEPVTIATEQGGSLHGMTLTLTTEI